MCLDSGVPDVIMDRPALWAGAVLYGHSRDPMPPLPKRKLSQGRRNRRRAHDALHSKHLLTCSNCGEKHLPHHICPNCGHYAGREVIEIERA